MAEPKAAGGRPWVRRVTSLGRVFMVALLLLVITLGGASVAASKSRPLTGDEGPEAEALADRIRTAVRMDAWAQTKAVRFTFAGRNKHLWDRERGLSRVEFGKVVVLQRLDQRVGRVWKGDREVYGKARERLVQKAWEAHINDTYWLNPFATLSNADVRRSVVELDEAKGLFVEYRSGGVTPGDAYFWEIDPGTGRPVAWRMWVKVIPIGGVRATWDGWVQLPTGAWISTSHGLGPMRLKLTELTGGTSLEALGYDEDPFDPLLNWD